MRIFLRVTWQWPCSSPPQTKDKKSCFRAHFSFVLEILFAECCLSETLLYSSVYLSLPQKFRLPWLLQHDPFKSSRCPSGVIARATNARSASTLVIRFQMDANLDQTQVISVPTNAKSGVGVNANVSANNKENARRWGTTSIPNPRLRSKSSPSKF